MPRTDGSIPVCSESEYCVRNHDWDSSKLSLQERNVFWKVAQLKRQHLQERGMAFFVKDYRLNSWHLKDDITGNREDPFFPPKSSLVTVIGWESQVEDLQVHFLTCYFAGIYESSSQPVPSASRFPGLPHLCSAPWLNGSALWLPTALDSIGNNFFPAKKAMFIPSLPLNPSTPAESKPTETALGKEAFASPQCWNFKC